MDWWKPQDKNQTTKIRFNATPNTYSSTHWVKGTGKSGCPICDELESEKTRRDNLFAFLKNIGAEDSAVGKAILKVSDEKIAMLEPKVTTKFNLTVDYIKKNVMPILHKYGMHEVDAFSAVFARFRSDPDYAVVLTVKDFSVFEMTPDIAINLIVHLYDEGHLTKK